jgi:hypothetical protein
MSPSFTPRIESGIYREIDTVVVRGGGNMGIDVGI